MRIILYNYLLQLYLNIKVQRYLLILIFYGFKKIFELGNPFKERFINFSILRVKEQGSDVIFITKGHEFHKYVLNLTDILSN